MCANEIYFFRLEACKLFSLIVIFLMYFGSLKTDWMAFLYQKSDVLEKLLTFLLITKKHVPSCSEKEFSLRLKKKFIYSAQGLNLEFTAVAIKA